MSYVLARVELTGRPIYTCHECRKQSPGDMVTVRSDTVHQAERMQHPQPRNMPVGWGSYHPGIYRCEEHAR
jgi:hypothetical protein